MWFSFLFLFVPPSGSIHQSFVFVMMLRKRNQQQRQEGRNGEEEVIPAANRETKNDYQSCSPRGEHTNEEAAASAEPAVHPPSPQEGDPYEEEVDPRESFAYALVRLVAVAVVFLILHSLFFSYVRSSYRDPSWIKEQQIRQLQAQHML